MIKKWNENEEKDGSGNEEQFKCDEIYNLISKRA
jgi:hypothetical protein